MLYFDHAELYDDMYEVIFDYDEQFSIVDERMKERKMNKVLEAACGTGRLTKRLYEDGYDVVGLDLSEEMLEIAVERVPSVKFVNGDIREFDLNDRFDAVVCLGHSFAHMINDEDIYRALECFNNHLKKEGLLIMDNFDALQTIKGFEKYRETKDKVKLSDKLVERDNYVDWNIGKGISWNWKCEYTVKRDIEVIDRFTDEQVLRSFLKSEIDYFLEKKGFKTVEFDEDRFIHVAEKVSDP